MSGSDSGDEVIMAGLNVGDDGVEIEEIIPTPTQKKENDDVEQVNELLQDGLNLNHTDNRIASRHYSKNKPNNETKILPRPAAGVQSAVAAAPSSYQAQQQQQKSSPKGGGGGNSLAAFGFKIGADADNDQKNKKQQNNAAASPASAAGGATMTSSVASFFNNAKRVDNKGNTGNGGRGGGGGSRGGGMVGRRGGGGGAGGGSKKDQDDTPMGTVIVNDGKLTMFNGMMSSKQQQGSPTDKDEENKPRYNATDSSSNVLSDVNVVQEQRAQYQPDLVGGVIEQAFQQSEKKTNFVIAELDLYRGWTSDLAFGKNPMCVPADVCLHGKDLRATALPGDIVAIELDPISEWKPKDTERGAGPHQPLGLTAASTSQQDTDGGASRTVVRSALDSQSADCEAENVTICRAVQHNPTSAAAAKRRGRSAGITSASHRLSAGMGAPSKQDYIDAWPADKQPQGKVVKVLERRCFQLQVCTLHNPQGNRMEIQSRRWYRFKSYDEQFPIIAVFGKDIPTHLWDDITQFLFLVEVMPDEKWQEGRFPMGRIVKSLGKAGTVETESSVIATTHHVKDRPFTDDVEACVAESCPIPSPEELRATGRRDLRQEEFVCTIDPATARDLDDALSIAKTPGGYRVGVHIADVSNFVEIGTPLDEEARERATSVYFVDRVIPMLPRRLCEDYCSLNAGVDKHAFSVIWHLDRKGNIQSEWFGQSIIRNRCRMAYEDAQKIIDGDKSGDSLVFLNEEEDEALLKAKVIESVENLFDLAGKLRAKRYEAGAISLNRAKLRFRFQDMNSKLAPMGLLTDRSKEANWLIEEFMLMANRRVATKIVQFLPACTLLRKHDAPDRKKLQTFQKSAFAYGIDVSVKGSKGLNDSLIKNVDHPDSDALRFMATLCMQQAKYTCSGQDKDESMFHYALAMPLYNHFTSPIRRYADLITHRQLLLALDIEKVVLQAARERRDRLKAKGLDPTVVHSEKEDEFVLTEEELLDLDHGMYVYHPDEIVTVANECNKKKEAARKAGDASIELFLCMFLYAIKNASGPLRPEIPSDLVLKVHVVRIQGNQFMIAHNGLGLSKTLYHNPHNQQVWIGENKVAEDQSYFYINWGQGDGAAAAAAAKTTMANAPALPGLGDAVTTAAAAAPSPAAEDAGSPTATQKLSPSVNETSVDDANNLIEKVSLFSVFLVTLKPDRSKGSHLELLMAIHPPWRRAESLISDYDFFL